MDDSMEEVILSTVNKMMEHKPNRKREKIEEIVRNYFEKGIPFYKSMGLGEDFMMFVYATGYQSFQAGKYNEACAAFEMLHAYDPDEPKYILGKALCFKEMKKYPNAINEFMYCASKAVDDPTLYWHMFECFEAMDESYGAASALGAVLYICQKTKSYDDLRLRAELALIQVVNSQEPIEEVKPTQKKVKSKT